MTARERVIHAYGGTCAHCLTPTGPFEIDHVHGGGNQHRKTLTSNIEYWLCREYKRLGYYPSGYQLLCQPCHTRKSGRMPRMPARKGSTSIQVSIPDELAARLTALASKPGETKSTVMEAALRQLLEGGASQTLLEGLHQRLDTLTATVQALEHSDQALRLQVQALGDKIAKHEGQYDEFTQAVGRLYDQAKAARNGAVAPPSLFRQLFPGRST